MAFVTVVIFGHAGYQSRAFSQQQPFLHRQIAPQGGNLLLDVGHGVLDSLSRDDAHWVHRSNEVVVRLSKLAILTRITGGPVKLLGIKLHLEGFSRSFTGHVVPSLQTIDDDHSQDNGWNDRPDQLQTVVVREESCLAVLVVGILPSKDEKQRVHQEEHRGDDPNVETHQPVQLHTVH